MGGIRMLVDGLEHSVCYLGMIYLLLCEKYPLLLFTVTLVGSFVMEIESAGITVCFAV